MNLFRRKRPIASQETEKADALTRLQAADRRVERLRTEATVITIRLPKQKRSPE